MAKETQAGIIPQSRAAALFNYAEVARFLGVDPYAILRDAKIAPELLAEPQNWIAANAVVKVYEDTAKAANCMHVGLLLVECRNFAHLGPISLLLEHEPTARMVVEAFVRHQRQMNHCALLSLEDDGEAAVIMIDFAPGTGVRQVVESAIGTTYRAITEAMAGQWQAECIHFRHSRPADISVHQRLFNCPIEFNADFDGISCASRSLDIANPRSNPALAAHAEQFLDILAAQQPREAIADRVRHAIHLLLHNSTVTIEKVADNLGIHSRALQRLLDADGTSFASLLNETRRELALRYLTTSSHSLSQISALLGYSTSSSFTRWFVNEFGKPPASWRSDSLAEGLAIVASDLPEPEWIYAAAQTRQLHSVY